MNKRNFLKSIFFAPFIENVFSKKEQEYHFLNKKLPKYNEFLPAIGLGTYRNFNIDPNDEKIANLKKIFNIFFKKNGKLVDTSPMYGRSERIIGKFIKEEQHKVNIFIATKVWTSGEKNGEKQIAESFNLLNARKIDLLQIHNLVDWKIHAKTLERLKEVGLVKYIGITHFHRDSYPSIKKILKTKKFDFLQINLSMIELDSEKEILPLAFDTGHAVIINRPFAQGSLFKFVRNKTLPKWSKEIDCTTWAQFFLKYIISSPYVTCAIPATSKIKHLLDNMKAMTGNYPNSNYRKKMLTFFQNE